MLYGKSYRRYTRGLVVELHSIINTLVAAKRFVDCSPSFLLTLYRIVNHYTIALLGQLLFSKIIDASHNVATTNTSS